MGGVLILAQLVGLLDRLGALISIALCLLAKVTGIAAVRRFGIADHRARWSTHRFIGVVLVMLFVVIAFDVSTIVSI